MAFNALIIGLVGSALSERLAWPVAVALGLVGGACGQFAAALAMPDAYVSGASQAYLSLCGAALLVLPRRSPGFWSAVVGTIVAVVLDLFVSDHAGLKPGHVVSFVLGVVAGGAVLISGKIAGRRRSPGKREI
jgi:hypothetical protein